MHFYLEFSNDQRCHKFVFCNCSGAFLHRLVLTIKRRLFVYFLVPLSGEVSGGDSPTSHDPNSSCIFCRTT